MNWYNFAFKVEMDDKIVSKIINALAEQANTESTYDDDVNIHIDTYYELSINDILSLVKFLDSHSLMQGDFATVLAGVLENYHIYREIMQAQNITPIEYDGSVKILTDDTPSGIFVNIHAKEKLV